MTSQAMNTGARGRGRALALLALAAALLPACATKRDLRDLRDEMVTLQASQDALFREIQAQNRLLLDTLRSSFAAQLDQRGQTTHRFTQLEQSLVRLEEMVNQTQLLMAQLNERLDRVPAPSPGGLPVDPSLGGGVSDTQARTMYDAGVAKIDEGAYSTARSAFEELLRQYPNDPLAPDAQYQLAETYAREEDFDRAIEELRKVEQQWPRSPRAPQALLRAGVISEEREEVDVAREFYRQVQQRYPASDAAREAERRLQAIGR
jgi:tol-pal system protein YbgF